MGIREENQEVGHDLEERDPGKRNIGDGDLVHVVAVCHHPTGEGGLHEKGPRKILQEERAGRKKGTVVDDGIVENAMESGHTVADHGNAMVADLLDLIIGIGHRKIKIITRLAAIAVL